MGKELFNIINDMMDVLDVQQLKKLEEVLVYRLSEEERYKNVHSNEELLEMFLTAKKLEGCSERTIACYRFTLTKVLKDINLPIIKIKTENLRDYLVDYQKKNDCSKTTVDNVRRYISSLFTWLEEEDYILKSPMKRIHKVKTAKSIKEAIADETVEKLRDGCEELRDLAMIDFLLSTGIRVGELISLDIDDLDLYGREFKVYGKGDKERKAYFDVKSKLHLEEYLASRKDDNPALFVSLNEPHNRLTISGVETRIKTLSRKLEIDDLYPHKFRRTMATKAIDKGMPIEQVQKILGHSQIETTLQYALVNQENVKLAHRKYLG